MTTTTKKATQTKKTKTKPAAKKAAQPAAKTTTKKAADHASARTAAGERARKAAIAIADANIARIEAIEAGTTPPDTSPAHAARVANGEVRLGKDATKAKHATRANVRAKAPKTAKVVKTPKTDTARKPSGLDLAAKVLADAGTPLSAKAIAERAIAAGWVTSGKTPHATLYAAIIREISKKGDAARFQKTDRGLFEAGKGA